MGSIIQGISFLRTADLKSEREQIESVAKRPQLSTLALCGARQLGCKEWWWACLDSNQGQMLPKHLA